MHFENSKVSDPLNLLLYLLDKIDLERSDKYVTLSNLSIYCNKILKYQKVIIKISKTLTKTINLNISSNVK